LFAALAKTEVTLKGIKSTWKGRFNKGVDAPKSGDNVRRLRKSGNWVEKG